MRKFLLATVLLLPLIVSTRSATAAPAAQLEQIVNCDALNTGTLICVLNESPETISKITCSGFWGTTDLNIPRGVIRPSEVTIVDFNKGKCNTHIDVLLRSGRHIKFDGFDTTNNTRLIVEAN